MYSRRHALAVGLLVAVLGLAVVLWRSSRSGPPSPPQPRPAVATPSSPAAAPAPSPAPPPAAAQAAPSPAPVASPEATLPAITIERSRVSGTDPAGRLQWELSASVLEVDSARQQIRLERVEGTFYEQGKPVLTFTAPRALFQIEGRDVVLSGGVKARGESGRALEADRVQWLAARRLLVATGNVRFEQEKISVRGDRLVTDVGLQKSRLVGNIKVTVRE